MRVLFEGTADEIAALLGSISSDVLMSEVYGDDDPALEDIEPISVIGSMEKKTSLF